MIVSHVISTGWMPVVVSQIRHPLEVWYPIPTLTNPKGQEEAPPTNLQPQQYPSTTGPKTITPIFAHEGSGTKTLNTKHPLFAFPNPRSGMPISTTGGFQRKGRHIFTLVNATTIKAFYKNQSSQ